MSIFIFEYFLVTSPKGFTSQGSTGDMTQQEQGKGDSNAVNNLSPQERKILKEILELKNKKDPRYATKIKDTLAKYPKIKDFILTQHKNQ